MVSLRQSSAYEELPPVVVGSDLSGSATIGASDEATRQASGQSVNYSGVQIGPQSHARRRVQSRVETAKPLAFSLTHGQLADAASSAFKQEVGDDAHSAKRLSRILECSWRSAENYLQGRTVPNSIHMLRAYAAIPSFAAEVRRLTSMERSLDPEFERDLSEFMQRASTYLDRRRGD